MTAPGLERVAAGELASLGLAPQLEFGGLAFPADAAGLARANLELRTVSRVILRIADFRATSFRELERQANRMAWDRFAPPGGKVRFRVTCRKSRLYHSDAVAQRLLAAAELRAGVVAGEVPMEEDEAVEAAGNAQLFVVRVLHDVVTVNADTSGALLHLRGYRQSVAKAPLRETLAAAMLAGVGWDGSVPLVDPMCGSGTIAIEGALIARRIAPGIASPGGSPRAFAFRAWPEHDVVAWTGALARAQEAVLPHAPRPIVASDRDSGACAAAHANAARAGVAGDIEIGPHALSAINVPPGVGCLVTNPPYGVRVGERALLRNLYAQLGNLARSRLRGWRVALLSADRGLERQLGIHLTEGWQSTNGGIPVRLVYGDAS
ncbi:MAG: RNA methyltransferase [Gemmatimonadaceae bacterium]